MNDIVNMKISQNIKILSDQLTKIHGIIQYQRLVMVEKIQK